MKKAILSIRIHHNDLLSDTAALLNFQTTFLLIQENKYLNYLRDIDLFPDFYPYIYLER